MELGDKSGLQSVKLQPPAWITVGSQSAGDTAARHSIESKLIIVELVAGVCPLVDSFLIANCAEGDCVGSRVSSQLPDAAQKE